MTKPRYTHTAVMLHWLVAVLIFGTFALGWFMVDLKISPDKLRYYSWHKWLGITVLGFALLRLLWRLTHQPPALPAAVPHWQRKASAAAHGLLYLLLFAIPLSGWAFSSASGYPLVYLGELALPDWVPKDKSLAAQLKQLHEWLTTLLMIMVGLHIGAALKHQFIDRDGLLRRMWFNRAS